MGPIDQEKVRGYRGSMLRLSTLTVARSAPCVLPKLSAGETLAEPRFFYWSVVELVLLFCCVSARDLQEGIKFR